MKGRQVAIGASLDGRMTIGGICRFSRGLLGAKGQNVAQGTIKVAVEYFETPFEVMAE